MCSTCENFCFESSPRRNSKKIKEILLKVFSINGLGINSKIAHVVPGWAEKILSVTIAAGHNRYQHITFFFAGLCDRLSNLEEQQKRSIEKDPTPFSEDAITTFILHGEQFCK